MKAGVEGAAKGAMDSLLEPIKQLTGEFCAEVGTAGGYIGKLIRLKTWLWTMQRAKQMLADTGIEPRSIPPKLFLPIMENASLEDDETLQEKWAALLANSANPNSKPGVHVAFAGILKELSPEEAGLLHNIYCYVCRQIVMENLPRHSTSAQRIDLIEAMKGYGTIHLFDVSELQPMIDNLQRLRLVETNALLESAAGIPDFDTDFHMTAFGFEFVTACRPPGSSPWHD